MLTSVKIQLNFNLRSPNSDKSLIRLVVFYGAFTIQNGKKVSNPLRVSLPWKISPAHWDKKKQQVSPKEDGHQIVNQMLQQLEAKIREYEIRCQIDGKEVDRGSLTEIIDGIINPRPKSETPIYFADALAQLIHASETGTRLKPNGDRLSEGTLRAYKNTLWHLENFEEWRGKSVRLAELNKEFGESLKEYFNYQDIAHNTKTRLMRILITGYHFALEKEWMEESDFPKARINEIQTDAIALSQDEVDTIYHLNLAGDPALDEARDLLITGIWTLMRFSDYSKLEDYNIKGNIIKSNTTKTDAQVHLPIHWQLQKIIDKHGGKLPRLSSLTVFNRQVKEVAQKAGITQKEEVRVYKGGKKTKEIVSRHTLVSSHTARRTGATLLYLDGVPKKQIMMLTGHKKEDTFDKYIRIGSYANAKILAERDIFKEKETTPIENIELENGFYWVQKKNMTTIAKVQDGLLEFMGNQIITVETWLKQGGQFLVQLKAP